MVWTFASSPFVLWVWIATALKGGDQWPVATAYIATTIFIWTVPSAEQVVKMIQAAGVLRSDPLSRFGFNAMPQPPQPGNQVIDGD